MSSPLITAKHLAVRLGTVARDLECETGEVPLYIRINGQRHALTIDNFQVDDDGSLLLADELLQPNPLKPLLATLQSNLYWYRGADYVRMADVEEAVEDAYRVDSNPSWTSVLAERIRQFRHHGYTHAGDDDFQAGELAAASISYLEEAYCQATEFDPAERWHLTELIPEHWPWQDEDWKPSVAPRRNLVKALALGLAELERLDRMASRTPEEANHG